jgi:hypothetical protein
MNLGKTACFKPHFFHERRGSDRKEEALFLDIYANLIGEFKKQIPY